MKTIDDILKRIQPEKLKKITNILNIRSSVKSKIKDTMLNFSGINKVISSLDRNELNIFKLLYSGNDDISFGVIQKVLGIGIDEIEKSVYNMNELMLTYIIKNRQMLNKKMDRVHCIEEITKIFKINESKDVTEYLNKAAELLISNNNVKHEDIIEDELSAKIIQSITAGGVIIQAESLKKLYPSKDDEKKINNMVETGLLKIFNIISDRPYTYIGLNEDILCNAATKYKKKNIPDSTNVSNNFKAITNILKAYDVISSSGLFKTKQDKFRKIDIKKISEAMLEIYLSDGKQISCEVRAHISMKMLNLLKCLKLEKDIGIINIKNISEKICDPVLIIKSILLKFQEDVKHDNEFQEGFIIPNYSGIRSILSILAIVKSIDYNYMRLIFIISSAANFKKLETDFNNSIIHIEEQFELSINILTILGLCDTINGKINLSESGKKIGALLNNKKYNKESEVKKSIYISPDFTLMIPYRDIDPVSLYTIMAFTEIVKEDVVLEAAITKSSIINAKKRGMHIETFISTLQKYAKNDIPQNLEFLLDDWTKQTMSINISSPILLHTSHGSFIDEILYSNQLKSLITRISEHYAILDKDSIDTVVKFSKKFDAVVTMFDDDI
ncbi:MAG: helicase-associated domain-containing protein [Spirochaetes bacterium]|nr:helicase-associated domain-containing protein [Spirochaetota bacterium]